MLLRSNRQLDLSPTILERIILLIAHITGMMLFQAGYTPIALVFDIKNIHILLRYHTKLFQAESKWCQQCNNNWE